MANEGAELPENDKLTDDELDVAAGGGMDSYTKGLGTLTGKLRSYLGLNGSGKD